MNLPSQMISSFDYFKKIVNQLYPNVTHLECDNWPHNVTPIYYHDGGMTITEYPPVVSWSISGRIFKYVLAPKIRNDFRLISGSARRPVVDYNEQSGLILELIKYSVEGKTIEEINDILQRLEG